MDTPQDIATNGIIALIMLTCATPCILVALVALWLGPARWPLFIRQQWKRIPERYRILAAHLLPLAWLIIGIFVGASLINPLARWIRILLP